MRYWWGLRVVLSKWVSLRKAARRHVLREGEGLRCTPHELSSRLCCSPSNKSIDSCFGRHSVTLQRTVRGLDGRRADPACCAGFPACERPRAHLSSAGRAARSPRGRGGGRGCLSASLCRQRRRPTGTRLALDQQVGNRQVTGTKFGADWPLPLVDKQLVGVGLGVWGESASLYAISKRN